jgi:phosphoribosylglycinamide formyltransferase 1
VSTRVAVFASGGGSNLQSIIDRCPRDAVEVALVISDRRDAGALVRAETAGIAHLHIPMAGRSGDDAANELLAALKQHAVDLVALAGYLRLVPAAVTAAFSGRMVNIHPALLPAFGGPGMYGRRVHEAVMAAGCRVSGATVHFVDERYDEGHIIAQWPVPVLPGDDAGSLAARVLRVEHALYPAAITALARRYASGSYAAAATTDAAGAASHDPIFRLGGGMDGLDDEIVRLAAF